MSVNPAPCVPIDGRFTRVRVTMWRIWCYAGLSSESYWVWRNGAWSFYA